MSHVIFKGLWSMWSRKKMRFFVFNLLHIDYEPLNITKFIEIGWKINVIVLFIQKNTMSPVYMDFVVEIMFFHVEKLNKLWYTEQLS